MTSQEKNPEEKTHPKKYLRLNYYGGTTSLGMLPRDTNWLKEILRFLHIMKAPSSSDAPEDDKSTPDY